MLSLLFASFIFAAAEIGPVEILAQRCQKNDSQVTCRVETSIDPSGVKYELSLSGEIGRMRPIMSLLPLAHESRIAVHFTGNGLRAAGENLVKGAFEKVIIQRE